MRGTSTWCMAAMVGLLVPIAAVGKDAKTPEPLRFSVTGCTVPVDPMPDPSDVPQTIEQLMVRIIDARPSWFEWVNSDDTHDATVTMTEKPSASTDRTLCIFSVRGTNNAIEQTFESVADAEVHILILFQGMYIAKNIKSIQGKDVKLSLTRDDGKNDPLVAGRDQISFTIHAPAAGYLYCFHSDSSGQVELLFPKPGRANHVRANDTVNLPETGCVYPVTDPVGIDMVKAVLTSLPITQSLDLMGIVPRARGATVQTEESVLAESRKSPTGTLRFGTASISFRVAPNSAE